MNNEERIKELNSKNNELGRVNIKLNQTLKEKTREIKKLKNKVGELEDRLYKVYSS